MKATVIGGWEDIPHLSAQAKADMLATYPPWQRDARTKGIPHLGSGAIFKVAEEDFVIPPMTIPPHWPRVFGLDVGWKTTAAVFAALDRESGVVYIVDEVYRHAAEPVVIAADIKRRGAWVPGVCDPAANGRSQADGQRLLDLYREAGLDVDPAGHREVEAGIADVWQRLSTGGLKVLRGAAPNLLDEYRIYRRNEQGKIVKAHDHALDALRYLITFGLDRATTEPAKPTDGRRWYHVSPPAVFAG